jgi:hypothetical protein
MSRDSQHVAPGTNGTTSGPYSTASPDGMRHPAGCGTGQLTERLACSGFRLTVIGASMSAPKSTMTIPSAALDVLWVTHGDTGVSRPHRRLRRPPTRTASSEPPTMPALACVARERRCTRLLATSRRHAKRHDAYQTTCSQSRDSEHQRPITRLPNTYPIRPSLGLTVLLVHERRQNVQHNRQRSM